MPRGCNCVSSVLIVDDNIFNLFALETLLMTKRQLHSVRAENGALAIDKFLENRRQSHKCNCGKGFKLILMDINMPVMDGCSATEHILRHQRQYEEETANINKVRLENGEPPLIIHGLSVVAVTSYTNKANINQCLRVGMK